MIHAAQVLKEGYDEVLRENLSYLIGIVGLILLAHAVFFFAWMQGESRRFKLCLEMGWEIGTLSAVPEWAVCSCLALVIVTVGAYFPYCLWVAFWEQCYPYLAFHGLPLPFPFSLYG